MDREAEPTFVGEYMKTVADLPADVKKNLSQLHRIEQVGVGARDSPRGALV